MEHKDITSKCVESNCGKPFTVLAEDVKFYIDKGLKVPKRCHSCRSKRKAEQQKRDLQEKSPFYSAKKTLDEGLSEL